jgi:hypothetical protein
MRESLVSERDAIECSFGSTPAALSLATVARMERGGSSDGPTVETGGSVSPGKGRASWALYAGLALTTCSMLLMQQFLTRIFSIQFNAGLAFLAISITFLGLGSAGVAVSCLPRLFAPERAERAIPWLAQLYSLLLVGGFVAGVALDHSAQFSGEESLTSQVLRVLAASLLVLPAMFAVGLVIALLLRANVSRVHRLYGADLAGGGIGCLLVLPLMNQVGGDHGIFVIAALASLGGVLLAHAGGPRGSGRPIWVGLFLSVLWLLGPWFNRNLALVDVRSHSTNLKEARGWVLEDREIERSWNALARLGFFETRDRSSLYVRIDSSCQTGLPSQDPRFEQEFVHSTDFERLPYALDRHARYLEIGAGGGRGLVLARAMGARRVLGVEINPGIVRSSLGGFPGFGVGPRAAADPSFELLVAEGRSFARTTAERFDTVTITFIQTGVASASAAFALSEANLFTVEAFTEFLSLLDEDGVFYVYRHGGNEMLRLISMARASLATFGVEDVRGHLYAARNATNRAVLLVGRSPFTTKQVEELDHAAAELGIEVLYSPSGAPGPRPPNPFLARLGDLRRSGELSIGAVAGLMDSLAHAPQYESLEATYIRSADPRAFVEQSLVDVSAPTDDRPYYFFTGLADWREGLLYFDPAGVRILGGTVILLFWMAAAFTALVAALILAPLYFGRGGLRAPGKKQQGLAVLAYFSGLGVGYIAVQISFIQRFTLFLGHPVYAISVVLLAFLAFSGLGSVSSNRLFRGGSLGFVGTVLALAALLALDNWLLPFVFHSSALSWPVAAKVALSLPLILPLAFLMGLLFPQGIRLLERSRPELVPWAWGANSAASILGSIFSLIFAIHFGFSSTALAAAAVYVVCCLPAVAVLRRSAA